jgi:hypothetical protein
MIARYQGKVDKEDLLKALEADVDFKAAGRAADASPQAQLQKMQALYQLAQNPASQLSPEKVEMAIIENMGISNIDSLLKENDERYQNQQGGPAQLVGGPGGPQGVPGPAIPEAVGTAGIPDGSQPF